MAMMAGADVPAEALARMRHAYAHDVGVLPPERVEAILRAGGFALPVRFFQAGLIHAWISQVEHRDA
jgi:tRNA (cmo5U34)-methyltransferase